jgi:hypothetical protein
MDRKKYLLGLIALLKDIIRIQAYVLIESGSVVDDRKIFCEDEQIKKRYERIHVTSYRLPNLLRALERPASTLFTSQENIRSAVNHWMDDHIQFHIFSGSGKTSPVSNLSYYQIRLVCLHRGSPCPTVTVLWRASATCVRTSGRFAPSPISPM